MQFVPWVVGDRLICAVVALFGPRPRLFGCLVRCGYCLPDAMRVFMSAGQQVCGTADDGAMERSRSNLAEMNIPEYLHIEEASLEFGEQVSADGSSGVVYKGIWTREDGERLPVAIKCVKCEGERGSVQYTSTIRLFEQVTAPRPGSGARKGSYSVGKATAAADVHFTHLWQLRAGCLSI